MYVETQNQKRTESRYMHLSMSSTCIYIYIYTQQKRCNDTTTARCTAEAICEGPAEEAGAGLSGKRKLRVADANRRVPSRHTTAAATRERSQAAQRQPPWRQAVRRWQHPSRQHDAADCFLHQHQVLNAPCLQGLWQSYDSARNLRDEGGVCPLILSGIRDTTGVPLTFAQSTFTCGIPNDTQTCARARYGSRGAAA